MYTLQLSLPWGTNGKEISKKLLPWWGTHNHTIGSPACFTQDRALLSEPNMSYTSTILCIWLPTSIPRCTNIYTVVQKWNFSVRSILLEMKEFQRVGHAIIICKGIIIQNKSHPCENQIRQSEPSLMLNRLRIFEIGRLIQTKMLPFWYNDSTTVI